MCMIGMGAIRNIPTDISQAFVANIGVPKSATYTCGSTILELEC